MRPIKEKKAKEWQDHIQGIVGIICIALSYAFVGFPRIDAFLTVFGLWLFILQAAAYSGRRAARNETYVILDRLSKLVQEKYKEK